VLKLQKLLACINEDLDHTRNEVAALRPAIPLTSSIASTPSTPVPNVPSAIALDQPTPVNIAPILQAAITPPAAWGLDNLVSDFKTSLKGNLFKKLDNDQIENSSATRANTAFTSKTSRKRHHDVRIKKKNIYIPTKIG
jgi:hypothetical protein